MRKDSHSLLTHEQWYQPAGVPVSAHISLMQSSSILYTENSQLHALSLLRASMHTCVARSASHCMGKQDRADRTMYVTPVQCKYCKLFSAIP